MWPLPIDSLHGCGKSTAQKLQLVGINTIGEAAASDPLLLQSILGQKSGAYIYNSANGISRSPVVAEREQAKSISNERTLSEDVDRENYQTNGIPVIRELAEKVASRMQKKGLSGQTVTFQVKADRLLNGPDGLFEAGMTIRLIGVGVSRLTEKQIHQMDLFEWADRNLEEEKRKEEKRRVTAEENEKRKAKQARLDKMMEMINNRYGTGTVKKGET